MIKVERATLEYLRKAREAKQPAPPPPTVIVGLPEFKEAARELRARRYCKAVFEFEDGACVCTLREGHEEKYHESLGTGRWKEGGDLEPAVDIIKTWPAAVPAKVVAQIFGSDSYFSTYYFTLGRGRPSKPINRLWFTYHGRILGSFVVHEIVQNLGQLPLLSRLDGGESEWQIRPGAWVAICGQGCDRNRDRLSYPGFRGYRYFDLEAFKRAGAAW